MPAGNMEMVSYMKDTVLTIFGFEDNRTIDFFREAETAPFEELCSDFCSLVGAGAGDIIRDILGIASKR